LKLPVLEFPETGCDPLVDISDGPLDEMPSVDLKAVRKAKEQGKSF
jgi:hypothetical protein